MQMQCKKITNRRKQEEVWLCKYLLMFKSHLSCEVFLCCKLSASTFNEFHTKIYRSLCSSAPSLFLTWRMFCGITLALHGLWFESSYHPSLLKCLPLLFLYISAYVLVSLWFVLFSKNMTVNYPLLFWILMWLCIEY